MENLQERQQPWAFSSFWARPTEDPRGTPPGLEGNEVAQAFLYTRAAKSCRAERSSAPSLASPPRGAACLRKEVSKRGAVYLFYLGA